MKIRLATEGRISEPVGAVCADICFMVNRDGRITSEHTHEDCIEFGFTPAELDAAEAGGGEWIDCPREEPYDSPARTLVNICAGVAQVATETLQEKLDAVIEERDTLLQACKPVLPHLRHYDQLYPCDAVSRDIGSLVSAIAKAEPKP